MNFKITLYNLFAVANGLSFQDAGRGQKNNILVISDPITSLLTLQKGENP